MGLPFTVMLRHVTGDLGRPTVGSGISRTIPKPGRPSDVAKFHPIIHWIGLRENL